MYTYLKKMVETAPVPKGYKAEITPCQRPGFGKEAVRVIHEEGERGGYAYPYIPLEVFLEYVREKGGGITGVMLVLEDLVTCIAEVSEFNPSDQMKEENVFLRLMNKESSRHLLDTVPYKEFNEEMVILYYFLIEDFNGNSRVTPIDNKILKRLGWENREDLYHLARKNTSKRFPVKMKTLAEVRMDNMKKIIQSATTEEEKAFIQYQIEAELQQQKYLLEEGMAPIVLSNKQGAYGASVILYPGLVKSLVEELGDFYLLPSSIHEWLLLPAGLVEGESICKMIDEVNFTVLQPEEILGYKPIFVEAETFLRTGDFSK